MKYQVQYESQNWIPSDIEAASPLEAAQLYLAQDSARKYEDYDRVVVFWGRFGKHNESFKVRDLLPSHEPFKPAAPVSAVPVSPSECGRPQWIVALADRTLPLAAIYAGVSAVLTLASVPFALLRHAAPLLPLLAALSAAALAAAAFGLYRRRCWSRRLFLIAAPWGPAALALVYKDALWANNHDFALTWLLVPVYGILALLLSRRNTVEALGGSGAPSWSARGGVVMAWCSSIAIILAIMAGSHSPRGGLSELGAWVMLMNLLWMLAVQYTLGLLLVSIPSRVLIRPPPSGSGPSEAAIAPPAPKPVGAGMDAISTGEHPSL